MRKACDSFELPYAARYWHRNRTSSIHHLDVRVTEEWRKAAHHISD